MSGSTLSRRLSEFVGVVFFAAALLWLIALASWRLAYLTMATLGLLLGLTALAALPSGARGEAAQDGFPMAWLAGLGLAILLIAAAGNVGTLATKLAMVAAGVALAAWLVRIDRRKAPGVLPSDAFAWSTPVGLGLWIVNFYLVLSWLQPVLLGGNWIVRLVPFWVAALTHLAFAWTMYVVEHWGSFVPYAAREGA